MDIIPKILLERKKEIEVEFERMEVGGATQLRVIPRLPDKIDIHLESGNVTRIKTINQNESSFLRQMCRYHRLK